MSPDNSKETKCIVTIWKAVWVTCLVMVYYEKESYYKH